MSAPADFRDSSLPVDARVQALLSQMTLDEKIAQLGSYWVYQVADGVTLSPEKAAERLSHGIGHITRVGGASEVKPRESAALTNAIQQWLIEHTRLGIPAIIHEECCSGYMAFGATVFPQAIGVGSTWEPELCEAMAAVIRDQMRSVGGHHALAPVLDIARDARWGRVEETFGEDPFLIAQMGIAYTRGIQSSNLRKGVIATGKHFVGYGMSEGGMNWAPPHLMPRELRETYLYPFEAAVREAGLASMMGGYHEIDGTPCSAATWLLTDLLRGEWAFDGTVVSDYFAVSMLHNYHHVAADKTEAARMALEAGLDVELPFTDSYGDPLRQGLASGAIPPALVDKAVERVLRQKFALGLFEQPYVDVEAVAFDTDEQRQLARRLAEQSIVLLRNEGDVLPLPKSIRSVAVIGPNADNTRNLFGDYAYPAHIETMHEQKNDNPFGNSRPPQFNVGDFVRASSIYEAIQQAVGADTTVRYAKGCDVRDPSTDGFAAAVEAARQSDVAVVVVGDKAGLTDDATSGEARDRAVLDLPGVQGELVRAIYETGTPIVLVLINGRPITLGWMAEQIPAIIEGWFPGEEGANAIADVLFGEVNPGGKLPISFPRAVGQIPVFYSHTPSGGRSHWKTDYVETPVSPLYPFGFGLSYTTFEYANLRLSSAQVSAGETVTLEVDIRNVGERAGDEVVQVYTHQLAPYVTRPLKELKGFKRVHLEAGETATVRFALPVNHLAYLDRDLKLVVSPGTVDVMVGSSSADIRLQGAFEIVGATTGVARSFTTPVEVEKPVMSSK